jgi:diguanylate cyclase (GGDEF)-like protein/PAS domain S-box-containing protein
MHHQSPLESSGSTPPGGAPTEPSPGVGDIVSGVEAHPGLAGDLLGLLLDQSSDGVCLVSPDGRIAWASAAAARALGFAAGEAAGRMLLEQIHPEDGEPLASALRESLAAPRLPVLRQFRCRPAQGTWRDLEAVTVNHLHDPRARAIVVTLRDLTERRELEQLLRESDESRRAVYNFAEIGFLRLRADGTVIDANRAALRMSGYGIDEVRGRSFIDFAHPEDAAELWQDFVSMMASQREWYRAERRYLAKDGRVAWVNVSFSALRDEQGAPRSCTVMLENITDRKRAEEELLQTNARLSVWIEELEQRTREIGLLGDLGDILQACKTVEEACAVVSPIAVQLFPRSTGSLSIVPAGSAATMLEPVASWGALDPQPYSVDDCWAIRRGRTHLVERLPDGLPCRHHPAGAPWPSLCVPMIAHGELLGSFTLHLGEQTSLPEPRRRLAETMAEHVALALANLRLHDTLRSQSIRDPLTGLFNRRYMEESLEREVRRAARAQQPVGVIMIDFDHFKAVNDAHGHGAGDALLRELGGLLQRSVRAEDIACRYGGEEFTLILPEASLAETEQRAHYLREMAKRLVLPYGRHTLGPVSLSAGVAICPENGATGDAVLRAADAALYEAKARGRDRVAVASSEGLFAAGLDFTG